MDSTDRGLGGDPSEVEPYGPPRLRQSAVQEIQSSGTDVWVPQAFSPGNNRVRQNRALLPVVHPVRGFIYFWLKSMSTESNENEGGSVFHRKGGSRITPEE